MSAWATWTYRQCLLHYCFDLKKLTLLYNVRSYNYNVSLYEKNIAIYCWISYKFVSILLSHNLSKHLFKTYLTKFYRKTNLMMENKQIYIGLLADISTLWHMLQTVDPSCMIWSVKYVGRRRLQHCRKPPHWYWMYKAIVEIKW